MKNNHIYGAGGLLIAGLFYVFARILGVEAAFLNAIFTLAVTVCVLVFCFGEEY